MNLRFWSLILTFGFTVGYGCEVLDPEEPIPSYIHIDHIDLTTDYITEGTDSEKITDAWIFVEDQLIGAWELPATIPILAEGVTNLKIAPGVKKNGISASRVMYPFFNFLELNPDLKPTVVDTLDLTTTYIEDTNIWYTDFEAGVNLQTSSFSDTGLFWEQDAANVFEGNKSAVCHVDENNRYFEALTAQNFELPTGGTDVYFEMNYKIENSCAVGIYAYKNNGERDKVLKIVLSPTTNDEVNHYWNKIYINLTNVVSQEFDADEYEIYIESSLDGGRSSGTLWFDNLKVVYP